MTDRLAFWGQWRDRADAIAGRSWDALGVAATTRRLPLRNNCTRRKVPSVHALQSCPAGESRDASLGTAQEHPMEQTISLLNEVNGLFTVGGTRRAASRTPGAGLPRCSFMTRVKGTLS